MHIKKIVTHEYPDFDCLYSIYLLRKFGESRYPGVREADLGFIPAGALPEGKTGRQLAEEGILTLDIEGGYYDHHDIHDLSEERSTASLVAIDLEVVDDPCLTKILGFIDRNDLQGISIQSRQAADHLICIPNIIKGLNLKYKGKYERVYYVCEEMFEAAYLNEYDWHLAIRDIDQGQSHKIGKFTILAFSSESTASAKAGRFRQGDLCIIHGVNDSMNFTTRKSKRWSDPDLTPMARIIRLAEAIRTSAEVDEHNLGQVGTQVDWFLHKSLCFFSRGSFKKTDVPPSSLSLNELHKLAIFCFDPQVKYLGSFANEYERFQRVLRRPMSPMR